MMAAGLGMTGWCGQGRHSRCSHRPGGPCEGGVFTCGDWYHCPCPCHGAEPVGQLGLFEVAV